MKAKLLVEIDTTLSPHFLNFNNYILMFFIPRILPKLGIALSTEEHYEALLEHAANLSSKTPMINLTIQEKKKKANKENAPATAEAQAVVETKGKKVNLQPQVITHISDQYSRRSPCPSRKYQVSGKHPKASGPLEVCSLATWMYWHILLCFP